MDKLIEALTRLYLAPETVTREALAQHIRGQATLALKLATADGLTRALAIPFRKVTGGAEGQHWTRLCEVANALQADFGLPAPAVSIDGGIAYHLWLSFAEPVQADDAQEFLVRLCQACVPEFEPAPDAATAPVYLPPSLNRRTGKWAAFIHPGMGASFADESGLEMAPPLAGQAAFLEGLESITPEHFRHALDKLKQGRAVPSLAPVPGLPLATVSHLPVPQPVPVPAPAPAAAEGLLLKDATLEDIVRFLQSKNIEPTFRFLMPK